MDKIRRAEEFIEPVDPVKASGAVIWDFTAAFRLLRVLDHLSGSHAIEETVERQPQ
jgi:hypothetical protein